MKYSQYYGLVAVIWIAPFSPNWINITLGLCYIAASVYCFNKDM